jgi:hypothetical protein
MSEQSYLLKLDGMAVPKGEIAFNDIANLAAALQLTATRIGRQVGRVEGPGRTPHGIDSASSLRLRTLHEGSTQIDFVIGDTGSLPNMSDETLIRERFEEIVASVAYNDPPEWISPLIANAAEKIAASILGSGAKYFSFSSSGLNGHRIIDAPVAVASLDCTVWHVDPEIVTETLTVSGELEAVDLRSNRFRVRDDVGNDIRLEDVADLEAAARLIGHRVVATGLSERDDKNRVRLVEPVLVAESLPANWLAMPSKVDGPGVHIPDAPVAGVTDAEIEDFLDGLRS